MKQKGQLYWCKKCDTFEFIPDQDGIKAENIVKVICPRCVCKRGHHIYKMYKVEEDQDLSRKAIKGRKKHNGKQNTKRICTGICSKANS